MFCFFCHGVFVLFCQCRIHQSSSNQLYKCPWTSKIGSSVWKNRFDAARVLDYDVEIDERVEIVYAGFQRFRDLVTVKTQVG